MVGHLESHTAFTVVVDETPCVITYEKCQSTKDTHTEKHTQRERETKTLTEKNHSVDGQRQIAHKYFILRLPFHETEKFAQ